jgi:hypothetical protein
MPIHITIGIDRIAHDVSPYITALINLGYPISFTIDEVPTDGPEPYDDEVPPVEVKPNQFDDRVARLVTTDRPTPAQTFIADAIRAVPCSTCKAKKMWGCTSPAAGRDYGYSFIHQARRDAYIATIEF